jgi:hypothetical protein
MSTYDIKQYLSPSITCSTLNDLNGEMEINSPFFGDDRMLSIATLPPIKSLFNTDIKTYGLLNLCGICFVSLSNI